jgi:excisionase family DNA binding protein
MPNKTHNAEGELSAVETAKQLGVGIQYLYGLLRTGRLKAKKVDKCWRISADAVAARLKQRGE